jgi:3-deoxy-7-phosphoheptulonate synthase
MIVVIGDKNALTTLPTDNYKLASLRFHPNRTVVDVGGVKIGGTELIVMAGPCAVETREQLLESASIVKDSGAHFLRGGAYKIRTSPYSFQGIEQRGLEYLAEAREFTGLKIVTEVTDMTSVDVVAEYVDVLQIGARNMQNFPLLRKVGRVGKPILLKRGMSATISEWLNAVNIYLMKVITRSCCAKEVSVLLKIIPATRSI